MRLVKSAQYVGQLFSVLALLFIESKTQSWLLRDICTIDNYEERDLACEDPSVEIIGGQQADPLRYPYLISLQSPNSRVGYGCFFHFCGASLIAPDYVLTAAHCIYDLVADQGSSSGKVSAQIYAALTPRCRHTAEFGRAKVTDYWYHPSYSSITIENDIAILKLDRPMTSEDGPFLSYKPTTSTPLTVGSKVTVAGWGDVSPEENNDRMYNLRHLMKGDLTILSWGDCDAVMATFTSRQVYDDIMICAYSSVTDSCAGDSGGPLIVTEDSSFMGNYSLDYQAGIVSWGPGQACVSDQTRFPGVYTRISAYQNWIDSIVHPELVESSMQLIDTPNFMINPLYATVQPGCTTDGGCTCKSQWSYNNVKASNCDNPDDDPIGSWCIVENSRNCQPLSVVVRTGEFWDRCSCESDITDQVAKSADVRQESLPLPELCSASMLGCNCTTMENYEFQGCSNPDNDTLGNWCYIDFSSCPRPGLLDQHTEKGFAYDYCKQGC
eukprot:TRINITY_DN3865_c0_g1_i3.p1 TRINITY_DN3865_c0_g1~~TRINITY_DN3865_c0_g1_i3.p1  ORF type:complete len:496 (+),score=16.46 TRINITY_DN3865_c0_g1_i3:235-1722(+)